MNCLNCKHWDRLYENPDVGVCELHNDKIVEAYRFQFKECTNWAQGEERDPYYYLFDKMLITEALEPNFGRIERYYARPFGEIVVPKVRQNTGPRYGIPDEHLAQVAEWRDQKKSRWWIATKLGVSPHAVETAERRFTEKGLK